MPRSYRKLVACKSCKEAIQPRATICIHCGSYQNWKSKLHLSNSVLAILVAFVAIGGSFGPNIVELLSKKQSALEFMFIRANAESIYIWIRNTGNRAAVLGENVSLVFDVPSKNKDEEEQRIEFELNYETAGLIKAQSNQSINVFKLKRVLPYTDKSRVIKTLGKTLRENCVIFVEHISFPSTKPEPEEISVECERLKIFIAASLKKES